MSRRLTISVAAGVAPLAAIVCAVWSPVLMAVIAIAIALGGFCIALGYVVYEALGD